MRILSVLLTAGVLCLSAGGVAFGEGTPSCEGTFGPGYTTHPDFPQACCHPGFVPYPGVMKCVRPSELPGAGGDTTGGDTAGGGESAAGGPPQTGAPGGHCIPSGGTCTLYGAPCCEAGESCQGKFPNTICQ